MRTTASRLPLAPPLTSDARDATLSTLGQLAHSTRATSAAVQLHDNLGRVLDSLHWPLTAAHQAAASLVAPLLPTLTLLAGPHDYWWASRPGTAVEIPDDHLAAFPLGEFIHAPLGQAQLVACPSPLIAGERQLVVTLARDTKTPFTALDLLALERTCATHFSALHAPFATITHLPSVPTAAEHTVELSPLFIPHNLSRYLQALLAFFYGPSPRAPGDNRQLPSALVNDIKTYRADFLRSVHSTDDSFYHAFTQRSRGRILCLSVQSNPDGRMRLTAHEDVSQHARLAHIKAACRALPRDRSSILAACLLVAEGVHAPAEIARRAGFERLCPVSALRLINRARRIVAAI
jgi:hypothetical protein